MAELRTETRLIADLQAHPQNYRNHPQEQISAIQASLTRLGQFRAVVVNTEDTILAGHGVVQAAQELGWTEITVHVFEGDEAEQRLVMVADNELSRKAEDDEAELHALLKQLTRDFGSLAGTGWGEEEHEARLKELAAEAWESEEGAAGEGGSGGGALIDRFGVPPFSVLDARQGYWQERKREWLALGIRSELGRGAPSGGSAPPR